jgi:hypothetical protein
MCRNVPPAIASAMPDICFQKAAPSSAPAAPIAAVS